MLRRLTNVIRPARFQGGHQRRSYFEGYYSKVVDAAQEIALAVIPGVAYDEAGEGHAFIQVLDGVGATAAYHEFALGEFVWGAAARQRIAVSGATQAASIESDARPSRAAFALCIGDSWFCESASHVRVPGLELEVSFRQNHTWPHRPWSPGAMGPFSFVPGMQCKHAVVSLHHRVQGSVLLGDAERTGFSESAIGYLEKDWGRSFPKGWIWLQTNHLAGETQPACLMVSAGVVPWVTGAFPGFIACILWRGRLERFTTYGAAKLRARKTHDGALLVLTKRNLQLRIDVQQAPGVDLAAPAGSAGMVGRVNESLLATASVELREHDQLVLSTTARYVGFEIGGDASDLL